MFYGLEGVLVASWVETPEDLMKCLKEIIDKIDKTKIDSIGTNKNT